MSRRTVRSVSIIGAIQQRIACMADTLLHCCQLLEVQIQVFFCWIFSEDDCCAFATLQATKILRIELDFHNEGMLCIFWIDVVMDRREFAG